MYSIVLTKPVTTFHSKHEITQILITVPKYMYYQDKNKVNIHNLMGCDHSHTYMYMHLHVVMLC